MAADLFAEGNELFVDEDYEGALTKYDGAIEAEAGVSAYWEKRAAAKMKLGNTASAFDDAAQAVALDSGSARAQHRKGYTRGQRCRTVAGGPRSLTSNICFPQLGGLRAGRV